MREREERGSERRESEREGERVTMVTNPSKHGTYFSYKLSE